jgi:5-methylcytosine-specific restriction endonuclease McrA
MGSDREYRELVVQFLLLRDGNICAYCHTPLADKLKFVVIDHTIALIDGGTNTIDNIRLLHKDCNARKESERVYRKTITKLTKRIKPTTNVLIGGG